MVEYEICADNYISLTKNCVKFEQKVLFHVIKTEKKKCDLLR